VDIYQLAFMWTAVDFGYADRMDSSCTIADTIAHHLPTLITPPDHNQPGNKRSNRRRLQLATATGF